jgi:hypothetical protein
MKIYIDFDGVIFHTEDILFEEYRAKKQQGIQLNKIEYISTRNWEEIINKSKIINGAIKNIALSDLNLAILTKTHSLNELASKVRTLRNRNLTLEIIGVPNDLKKCDIVNPKGNVLIDDSVANLDDWSNEGGLSIFFNKDNLDYDTFAMINSAYPKIDNLKILQDEQKILNLFKRV